MKRLEKLNCTVPAFLNAREAAFRLEKNRKTAELLGESFRACKASSIRTCLEAWRACADDPSLSVEERQLILLSMVHPLWVRLEEVLYLEAHTPESEEPSTRRLRFWKRSGHEPFQRLRQTGTPAQGRAEKSPSGGCAV